MRILDLFAGIGGKALGNGIVPHVARLWLAAIIEEQDRIERSRP